MIETRQFRDILAFRKDQGIPLAFHSRNLEMAELSLESWESLLAEIPLQEISDWDSEINVETKAGNSSRTVRNLTLNVTQICNLKCTYCAAGGDGTYGSPQAKLNIEKTLPQLKFFLDKIKQGETFHITFLGGEPLLYPDGIEEVARYVLGFSSEKGIKATFSIVTNGTIINDRILSILKFIKPKVTVSLDGPEEINDIVRPAKDAQLKTSHIIKNILILAKNKNEWHGPLVVHGVFNQKNMDVLGAYDFFKKLPVDRFEFTYSVSESDSVTNKNFIEQMQLIAKKAYAEGGELELRKIGLFDHYFSALDNQQQTWNHCGAGKSFLMIDAQNNLYTCPWDVGHKNEAVGHGTVLNSARLDRYKDSLVEQNNCQTCWARFLCGGGCMYVHKQGTGDKHNKDGQFCDRTRSLILTTLLYYKQSRNSC